MKSIGMDREILGSVFSYPFTRQDESKNRLIMVRIGYRYIFPYSGDASPEHRGVLEATGRYPLALGVLVSDRNRLDLRSIDGVFSWRYRNRLTVERNSRLNVSGSTPMSAVKSGMTAGMTK